MQSRRAGGAAFGIRLSDYDRRASILGKGSDYLKPVRDRSKLVAYSHPHVSVDNRRRSLCVKTDVVERRSGLSRRSVSASQAVLEKIAQKLLCLRAVWSGDMRPADPGRRERALQCVRGEVVKLEIFFGCGLPVADIRFVPEFPVPALNFFASVAADRVTHPLVDQVGPFSVVPRRIRPSGEQSVVGLLDAPLVTVR